MRLIIKLFFTLTTRRKQNEIENSDQFHSNFYAYSKFYHERFQIPLALALLLLVIEPLLSDRKR